MTLVSCRVYPKDMTILTTTHKFIYSNERWAHCVCEYGLRSSREKKVIHAGIRSAHHAILHTHSKHEFYSIECACTTSALLIHFGFLFLSFTCRTFMLGVE